jgi:signal transduction histidine kinase
MTPVQIKRIGLLRQFGRDIHEQQGMGLGLALASRLAELSGGEFRVQPNINAPGISVELRLPLATDRNENQPPKPVAQGTEAG